MVSENQGIFAVEGMNLEEFGEPEDSGSIIVMEAFDNWGHLEVVAILSGKLTPKQKKDKEITETTCKSELPHC